MTNLPVYGAGGAIIGYVVFGAPALSIFHILFGGLFAVTAIEEGKEKRAREPQTNTIQATEGYKRGEDPELYVPEGRSNEAVSREYSKRTADKLSRTFTDRLNDTNEEFEREREIQERAEYIKLKSNLISLRSSMVKREVDLAEENGNSYKISRLLREARELNSSAIALKKEATILSEEYKRLTEIINEEYGIHPVRRDNGHTGTTIDNTFPRPIITLRVERVY